MGCHFCSSFFSNSLSFMFFSLVLIPLEYPFCQMLIHLTRVLGIFKIVCEILLGSELVKSKALIRQDIFAHNIAIKDIFGLWMTIGQGKLLSNHNAR